MHIVGLIILRIYSDDCNQSTWCVSPQAQTSNERGLFVFLHVTVDDEDADTK